MMVIIVKLVMQVIVEITIRVTANVKRMVVLSHLVMSSLGIMIGKVISYWWKIIDFLKGKQ